MDIMKQWCIEQAVKLGKMDYIAEAKKMYKEVRGEHWDFDVDKVKAVPTGVLEAKERYFEQKYSLWFMDVYKHSYVGGKVWLFLDRPINVKLRAFIYTGDNPFEGIEMKFTEARGTEMWDYKEYYMYELSRVDVSVNINEDKKIYLMLSGMAYVDQAREEWNSWGDDTMKMFIERVKRGIEENEEGLEEKLKSEYRCESLKSYKQ